MSAFQQAGFTLLALTALNDYYMPQSAYPVTTDHHSIFARHAGVMCGTAQPRRVILSIPIIQNGANEGEERRRVKREGYPKTPKLREKRSDTGGTYPKSEAGEEKPSRERSQRAMDLRSARAGEPDDYDEDKP